MLGTSRAMMILSLADEVSMVDKEIVILEQARAKVNLWLKILGKRNDGFHDLETLMVPLELSDEVRMELGGRGVEFACEGGGADVPVDAGNLAVRAAEKFLSQLPEPPGVKIFLQKRIPSGAGLGGGSSDAAAVLRGLQKLLGDPLSDACLEKMALDLGSDVPFFLDSSPALCRGRGEIRTPACQQSLALLLVKPPFGVSTAWAYREFARGKTASNTAACNGQSEGLFFNSLAVPVFKKYPVLEILRRRLLETDGVRGSALSGSGSTVFAVFEEGAKTAPTVEKIQREFGATFQCILTRTISGTAKD